MSAIADLHLHTHFSDGTESPERVVALAKQAGLCAISITDHDSTDSMELSAAAAKGAGIELIPGIEMSASSSATEVHILGYLADFEHPALKDHLEQQKRRRIERVHEMVKRLQRLNIKIDAEEVFEISGQGTVGRPHVARILMKHGYVSTISEAFKHYIGDDKPAFVPGSTVSPKQVIRLLLDAGGVPVLAHPVFLKNDELIAEFAKEGLAGIEVYHSSHKSDTARHYEEIADRLHLLKTGGSDFHGDTKEGVPVGAASVPYALVEGLKEFKPRSAG